MDDGTAAKIAENQSAFRRANEEIRQAAEQHDFADPIPFLCECADGNCREIVRLSRREYEDVRADPTHFVTLPGHGGASGPVGKVIADNGSHHVVAKIGLAGDVAAELDTRSAAD